jgi:hypothetical protein
VKSKDLKLKIQRGASNGECEMFQKHFMMGQINMAPSQKRKSCEHNPKLICWQFFLDFWFNSLRRAAMVSS